MIPFVTLARAKEHLYVIEDADDALIAAQVAAASGAVQNYLKSSLPFAPEIDSNLQPVRDSNGAIVYARDSNGDRLIREEVQQATLILLGHFYKNRDDNPDSAFPPGYLPAPCVALLYPLRDPALGG